MKRLAMAVAILGLTFSAQSQAQSWFDSLKNMLGFGEEVQEEAKPNVSDMVSMLTQNLGVDAGQAQGGLGSIFNYVKGNLSEEKYGQLTNALPGVGELIKSAPDISQLKESGGLSGLLDKAAEHSESLKAINDVKKQFEALGLKPEMIMQYVEQAKQYLDTDQGKEAKEVLMQGVGNLLG